MEGARALTAQASHALQAEVNIGFIGHVDAGKTSLVQALSGEWVDTHSEELKRGISIRLGYADVGFYSIGTGKDKHYFASRDGKDPETGKKGRLERRVSFVDAPGHETLMATMLSGAALMDGAVLVVAADETCPQPQTIEHLQAVRIAGVRHLVVAQSKIDLVTPERARASHKEITAFLKENGYKDVPVVPVASHHGTNIDLLVEALLRHIPVPKKDPKKPFKMYCVRSFDVNKPGQDPAQLAGGVLGGSILQGRVRVGDTVEISPGFGEGPVRTPVAGISTRQGPLKEAVPGGLVALSTELDPSLAQNDQLKGQVVAAPGSLPDPVRALTLQLTLLERPGKPPASFAKGEVVVLTIGTASAIARVQDIKKGTASLELKYPAVVEPGQTVAVSKKEDLKWRLVAYGTVA